MCIHTEALKGRENENTQLDIGISENRGRGLTGQFRPTLMGLCLVLDKWPRRHLPYCIISFIVFLILIFICLSLMKFLTLSSSLPKY